jgi:imidazolonepropionase-like amidohydrolase
MRYLTSLLLLHSLFGAAAFAEPIAFVNVNVIPMTSETVLPGRTVIVSGGKITAIGEVGETPLPDDAQVIDGTDRYLLPGLVEMHGHVPGTNDGSLQRVLGLYVANGITTVRGMLGRPAHLDLRRQLLDGDILGPRLITSGPSFNGRSVASPGQARQMVREQHAAGYDFLKVHPGLNLAEFDAIASTATELGIPFAGHVPEDVGLSRALQAGIATIDHLDGYMAALTPATTDTSGGFGGFFGVFLANQVDAGKIREIAAETASAGVWNVPTQSLFEHVVSDLSPDRMADWPEMRYMPAETVARWVQYKEDLMSDAQYSAQVAERAIELRQELIRALRDEGAGLLLGSDAPQIFNVPGFSLHRELRFLVAAGLSPYEALASGTVNPAKFFGDGDTRGRIEPGYSADLLLVDANPLEDIGNTRRVHGVMLRDRWLSRQELDRILSQLER